MRLWLHPRGAKQRKDVVLRTLKRIIAAAVLAGSPNAGVAEFRDGNDLYLDCQQTPSDALEFVVGATDTILAFNGFGENKVLPICIPENVSAGQLRDVVCLHLEREPGGRHYTAATQVMSALIDEFPCPRSS